MALDLAQCYGNSPGVVPPKIPRPLLSADSKWELGLTPLGFGGECFGICYLFFSRFLAWGGPGIDFGKKIEVP